MSRLNIHPHISRFTRFILLATLVSAALATATILFVLAPRAAEYRQQLESLLQDATEERITIEYLAASVYGINPELVLKGIAIADAEGRRPPLRMQRLSVALAPLRSLIERRPVLAGIGLSGAHIELQKTAEGKWNLLGLKDSDRQPTWLLGTRHIWLNDMELTLSDAQTPDQSWSIQAECDLFNDGDHHRLRCQLDPQPSQGQSITVAADLETAESGGSLPSVTGRIYVYARRIQSLPPTSLMGLQVNKLAGAASIRAWIDVDDNTLQRVTTHIDATHPLVEFRRNAGAPGRLELDGLSGWLQWSGENDIWHLTGNGIDLRVG